MPATAWDDKAEYLMKTRKVMFNDDYLAFLVERVWKITQPVDIVDFGCGLGYLGMKLLPLLPQGSTYTGIDASEPLLEQARGIFANMPYRVHFKQADLVQMQGEPCVYDLAVCQALLMHMAEPKKIIGKMMDCVKPGGLVIGIEPHWNGSMASMHVDELEINKRVDLGVLQRLYEFDRCQSGRDGNIGLKLPVYFRQAGLCGVQSRLSDAVAYLHPGLDEDAKETIYNVLKADGYTTPPEDRDGFIANLTGRGTAAAEASDEFERETYLAEHLRDHGREYNTVFAYHMVISWGGKALSEMKRAAIVTLGCKVNWYDSRAMAAALEAAGFVVVADDAPADVYIVNTCAVTAEAERKSRKAVRRLIRMNPDAAVIAAGCSSQKDPEAFSALEGLAAVCGTADRASIAALALQASAGARGLAGVAPLALDYEDSPAEGQTGHTRAVLKIEDGCDARCAYCIIPDLRGEPRSRSIESIQKEAAALAVRGFREIVLVGINLSRYGVGLPGHLTLADAVEAAAAPGIDRIRLGSLEPDAICEGLLERLAALSQFCPHFHVSLQSGSAETLKRMGRRYNPRQYMEKLESIRRYWPQAGITTDIIVGFPGETEEEFAESAAFAAGAGFLKVHVFPYSRRAGTRAAELPNQVPKAVREACATAMQAAAAPSSQAFLSGLLGSTAGVLFEEPVQDKPGWMRGYTSSYVDVEAKVGDGAKGEIIQILLTELDGDVMIGAAQPESYKR